jgi:hypothetical protein
VALQKVLQVGTPFTDTAMEPTHKLAAGHGPLLGLAPLGQGETHWKVDKSWTWPLGQGQDRAKVVLQLAKQADSTRTKFPLGQT